MHNTADCIAVVGSSGTGKGVYAKQRIRAMDLRARRLLVWSPLEQTDAHAATFGAHVAHGLREFTSKLKRGARRLVLVPSSDPKAVAAQFTAFCRIAWLAQGSIVFVEELSRVTRPSYAPPAWQNLSTAGRHRGLTVIATAQRPAQIDKDFLGNCTEIRCYRVGYDEDARNLAAIMHEPAADFLKLPDLHYIHRHVRELRNVRGIQPLPGAKKTLPESARLPL